MRILVATDAWHPQVNGVVRTLTMMAEAAKGLGVEVSFLTPQSFRTFALPSYADLRVALPGRRHIVLTRDRTWHTEGAEVAHTGDEALALADGDVAVIGGAEVFALFLDRADRIELTEVHVDAEGDATVPAFGTGWREIAREDHASEAVRPAYSFVTLERMG